MSRGYLARMPGKMLAFDILSYLRILRIKHSFALLCASVLVTVLFGGTVLAEERGHACYAYSPIHSSDEVFYISVFGGYFPIPTRYALLRTVDDQRRMVWEFVSPVEGLRVNSKPVADDQRTEAGRIKVGNIVDFPHKDSEKVWVTERIRMCGLNVVLYHIEPGPWNATADLTMVDIEDGKRFIRIIDEDELLWLKLLKLYAFANGLKDV